MTCIPAPDGILAPLTPDETYRLVLFKWRYSLEAEGFEPKAVARLLFLKWAIATGHLRPQPAPAAASSERAAVA